MYLKYALLGCQNFAAVLFCIFGFPQCFTGIFQAFDGQTEVSWYLIFRFYPTVLREITKISCMVYSTMIHA